MAYKKSWLLAVIIVLFAVGVIAFYYLTSFTIADNPPVIHKLWTAPENPKANQNTTFCADVGDDYGVKQVNISVSDKSDVIFAAYMNLRETQSRFVPCFNFVINAPSTVSWLLTVADGVGQKTVKESTGVSVA